MPCTLLLCLTGFTLISCQEREKLNLMLLSRFFSLDSYLYWVTYVYSFCISLYPPCWRAFCHYLHWLVMCSPHLRAMHGYTSWIAAYFLSQRPNWYWLAMSTHIAWVLVLTCKASLNASIHHLNNMIRNHCYKSKTGQDPGQ